MKKFRINELTGSNDSNTSGHHGMRSPSSLSLASSSTSINHQTADRLSLTNNNVGNMVHSAEPQRTNQFYHTENNLLSTHNDNINWRDEADGSEEEECRLNVVANSSELQPTNLQSNNLFGQHSSSNLLSHQAPLFTNMVEQDMRCQTINNNCSDGVRTSADKNLDSNFKEKQLRETEFCINRIEDLLVSFKNLFKPDEPEPLSCGPEGNMNNINSSLTFCSHIARKSSQTVPKMTNNSNVVNFPQPTFPRLSNHFVQNANSANFPKNTQPANEPCEGSLRFSKNSRKFSNNRHLLQTDLQPHLQNSANAVESDSTTETLPEPPSLGPDVRIDQFYHLLNTQINTLRKRLEQLASAAEIKENYSQSNLSNFNDGLHGNRHFSSGPPLYDIDNCCIPVDLHQHESDDLSPSSTYFRTLNQQIYQLLMFQNYQINQQHQLIQGWINTQQKWLEKQPSSMYKLVPGYSNRHHSVYGPSNPANNVYLNDSPLMNNFTHSNGSFTLNNQTEPRSRANNFLDNFRSHSHQNKLQSNLDIGPFSRDPYSSGGHHGNGSGSNCSNSCINIGPCNKNSRSQSFAGFSSLAQKSRQNNFAPSQGNIQPSTSTCDSTANLSNLPYLLEKKLNNNVGNNIEQLNKILSMVGKMAEADSTPTASSSSRLNSQTKTNIVSNSRAGYPLLNSMALDSKNSVKRKKTSNMNIEQTRSEKPLHENVCEFENEDDEHDSIDMESGRFEPVSLGNESSSFNSSVAAANSRAPTALPTFHMDKFSFHVPLTISPHTGAIRKKPIYDCNFKFAATDNQKLSMQHHSQVDKNDSNATFGNSANLNISSNESVRPLMPAEGRSSEQLLTNSVNPVMNMAIKPKLSNSSHKYSKRPPIAGAGNESIPSAKPSTSYADNSHSSQDSLSNGLDDDIKWNKLNSDTKNNGTADKMPSNENDGQDQRIDSPCNGSDDRTEVLNRPELSPSTLFDDERLLDGSTEPELAPMLPNKSKSKDAASSSTTKCESSFQALSSVAHPSLSTSTTCTSSSISLGSHANVYNSTITAANKSISSNEPEAPQLNGVADNGHNAVNGRFLPEETIRINGHHMADHDDDDLDDDDKDTDVRLLSLAGNAVEVRSTVRLSGDGEQGL